MEKHNVNTNKIMFKHTEKWFIKKLITLISNMVLMYFLKKNKQLIFYQHDCSQKNNNLLNNLIYEPEIWH